MLETGSCDHGHHHRHEGDDRYPGELEGTDAADKILGLAGNDVLVGFAGDDELEGGAGADELFGSEGFDFASYRSSNVGVYVSLNDLVGQDGHAEGDRLSSIEGAIGSAFKDNFYGSEGRDIFYGEGGNDQIGGQLGDDEVHGGAGNDLLSAAFGNDDIYGDAGNDTVELLQLWQRRGGRSRERHGLGQRRRQRPPVHGREPGRHALH